MRNSLRNATFSACLVAVTANGCDRVVVPESAPTPSSTELAPLLEASSATADANDDAGGAPENGPAAENSSVAEHEPLGPVAFFLVRQKGWVVLTDSGFAEVPDATTSSNFSDGFQRFRGRLVGLGYEDWFELRPEGISQATDIPKIDDPPKSSWTTAPDGSIWTLSPGKVAHLVDAAWKTVEFDPELPDDVLYTGIAVDADGEPWVATGKAIFRRKENAWVRVSFPGSREAVYLEGLTHSPRGDIYLPSGDSIFLLGDSPTRVKLKSNGRSRLSAIKFVTSSEGELFALAHGIEGVSLFLPEEKSRFIRGGKKLNLNFITESAVDGQGRVWLSGDAGLAVAALDGTMTSYPSGSVELIAGKLKSIIILGDGPPLPSVSGEIATGSLSGAISRDGVPLAQARVEICASPSGVFTRSPCAGRLRRFKGKTDEAGRFLFADVPLGSYGIAIKTGRSWRLSIFPTLGARMKSGETSDIGTLNIDTEED
ncbi:MAG: hypothetical protein JKY37_13025 [Nannocystaceae bacterium]|nr:hypothetical protein [Nannocystaceae bacterium]